MAEFSPNVSTKPPTYLSNTEKDIYEYEGEKSNKSQFLTNTLQTTARLKSEFTQSASDNLKDQIINEELNAGAAFAFFENNEKKPISNVSKANRIRYSEHMELLPSYILNTSLNFSEQSQAEKESTSKASTRFYRNAISTQFETPLSRLNRLQNELNELEEFLMNYIPDLDKSEKDQENNSNLSKFTENKLQDVFLEKNDPVELLEHIKELGARVSSLSCDPKVHKIFDYSDPLTTEESGFSKVKKHLENKMSHLDTIDTELKNETYPTGENESITYELYSEKTMKPILENNRMITLERKLTFLENRLGINKLALLPFNDVTEAIEQISSRLASLDHKRIEAIHSQMKVLLKDLQAINLKRKELTGLSIDEHKIESLYELCNRWKLIAFSTPAIIKRLQTLKMLHQEASGINSRLNVMETQLQEMTKVIETTKNDFNEVKTLINENTEWAKRTTDGLTRRMDELNLQRT